MGMQDILKEVVLLSRKKNNVSSWTVENCSFKRDNFSIISFVSLSFIEVLHGRMLTLCQLITLEVFRGIRYLRREHFANCVEEAQSFYRKVIIHRVKQCCAALLSRCSLT